jgi:hypothetical protein
MSHKSAERQFLHDIASPIGTAIFQTDMLLEETSGKNRENQEQIGTIMTALLTVKSLLEERRKTIANDENKSSTA